MRDCTTLQLRAGESCKSNVDKDASQSFNRPSTDDNDDNDDGDGDDGQQSQQPARSCVWACNWDGCNDAPLSTAARSQHQLLPLLQLLQALSVAVIITTSTGTHL